MSGIAGIIHFDGKLVEPGLIEKMTGAMAYRGPDGINGWVKGSVALGQCMLRTTPESLEEVQPLSNEDESLVLVMDGRVDNWEELRKELLSRGAKLRTRVDAELVLRAYEVWGPDCLEKVEGDFALVIWDARQREVFCARDRIGNKPLHYWRNGETFVFASDLHAILPLPWVAETLNRGTLAEFLAAEWYSRDETFWEGILRLVAGHRMRVGISGLRVDEYWKPDYLAPLPCRDERDLIAYYRALLTDIVRRMSRCQRPLACEVSGGLDSSAILAVAQKLHREGRLLAPSLHAYTLDFGDDPDANDLPFAREVGTHLGIQVREIPPTCKPLSWYRELGRTLRNFPGFPNGVMGLGICEYATAQGSRALVHGVGGDEWLSGTPAYYAEELASGRLMSLYRCLQADRKRFGVATSAWWLVRFGIGPLLPRSARARLRNAAQWARTLGPRRRSWLAPALENLLQERRERAQRLSVDIFKRVGQRYHRFLLCNGYTAWARELEERSAAVCSIELRGPLFDPRLVQFSAATPERLWLSGGVSKMMHRKALAQALPDRVLWRQDKAEFSSVFRWHLDELTNPVLQQIASIRQEWVQSAVVAKNCGRNLEVDGAELWRFWTLFGCDTLCAKPPGAEGSNR